MNLQGRFRFRAARAVKDARNEFKERIGMPLWHQYGEKKDV